MDPKTRVCSLGQIQKRCIAPLSLRIAFFFAVLLPFTTLGIGASAHEDAVIEEILAAWRDREKSIRSFQYECDMEVSKVVKPWVKSEKPDNDVPAKHVVLDKSLLLSVSGEKMAAVIEGEWWDYGASVLERNGRHKAVFDGHRASTLSEGLPVALAQESTHETASDLLKKRTDLLPFWLLHDTVSKLDELGYEPKKISISQMDSFHNGRDCMELTVPLAEIPVPNGVTLPFSCFKILVDPGRKYLPLLFRELQEGAVLYETSIEYVPDDRVGWVACEFHATQFRADTGQPESRRIKVKDCSINETIDESVFAIECPVGAHIAVDDGPMFSGGGGADRQFFVQLPDGKRRRIAESAYGRSPPPNRGLSPRVVLMLVSGFLLAVFFGVLWRRGAIPGLRR